MASITENLIQDVQIGDQSPARLASSAYGICDSAAADTIKVVEMTGFQLMEGVTIHVKFNNANTASNPTLNVQTSGAFPIVQYGTTGVGVSALTSSWPAGAVVSFTLIVVGTAKYWAENFGVNTDTQYDVQDTYNNTSSDPISGKGVKAALETLDITAITNTAGKTVETITEQDGKVGATFQDIQIGESQVTNLTNDLAAKAPIANPTFTGTVTLPAAGPQTDNEAATKKYVDDRSAGLTGAMHYIDAPNAVFTVTYPTPTQQDSNPMPVVTVSGTMPTGYIPKAGDIIIYEHQEFIYTGSAWRLLGDEGSYALKTNTVSVVEDITISHTIPSLTVTDKSIPNVTNAGTAPSLSHSEFNIKEVQNDSTPTTMKVENGTLKITIGSASTSKNTEVSKITNWSAGSAATLGTAIEVGSASNWSAGTQAAIATLPKVTVVKP